METYTLTEERLFSLYKEFMDFMIKNGNPDLPLKDNFKQFIETVNILKHN